jgi:phosphoglycolate phosphatase
VKIKNIIFDFDGTLVDSAPTIIEAYNSTFSAFGIYPCLALDKSLVGPPLEDTLKMLSGISDADIINKLSEYFRCCYDSELCLTTKAFSGVNAMLDVLVSLGIRLFIVTNKRLYPTIKIINKIGWGGFEAIFATDSFPSKKLTKQELINKLLIDYDLDFNETISVGDVFSDGVAANQNNLVFFLVSWGYMDCSYDDISSSWKVIRTPADLLDCLS